jgi:glucuronate isomerase
MDQFDEGKVVFSSVCSECHGEFGEGTARAPMLVGDGALHTFDTMIGNFQDGSVPGKLQYGSAWWFLDQLEGMERQMNALSNMSLLYCFVGILTDSRSFFPIRAINTSDACSATCSATT